MRAPRLRRFYGAEIEKDFAEALRFMQAAARLVLRRDMTANESFELDDWLGRCFEGSNPSRENELLKEVTERAFLEKQGRTVAESAHD